MADKYLKAYLKNNFSFSGLKKVGFYSKDIKATDYEKQAERICNRLGLKNIYDFSVHTPDYDPDRFANGFKNTFGENILNVILKETYNIEP